MAENSSDQYDVLLSSLTQGSMVAGYRLENRIGAGGMAVVFRARDEQLRRVVALKVLAPALASDPVFRHQWAMLGGRPSTAESGSESCLGFLPG